MGTFGANPLETIEVSRGDNRDLFTMSYYDVTNSSHRIGWLSFDSQDSEVSFLNDLSLIQNFSYEDWLVLGNISFGVRGTLNGVDYSGDLYGEINRFEIHVREPATVPEPSSILLALVGLAGLFLQRFRKSV